MKKISALFVSVIMVITSVFVVPLTASAAITIPTDVEAPASDCVMLGIKGKYVVDTEKALKRINEIRKEACVEGVPNPSTGVPLTMSDYVPIKWSSDLEYIARIRAAESSITMAHQRTNLRSHWSLAGPDGNTSYGEVLAWNFGTSVVAGINQWYNEKSDWVNQNEGAVTGHYTQMIDPENTYVGLGTFCSELTRYYNTTCGQFSCLSSMNETRGTAVDDCIQVLEVSKSLLSGKYEISGASNLQVGKTAKYNLITSVSVVDYWGDSLTTDGLYVLSDVKWSTSDSSIAYFSNNVLTVSKCGDFTIIAKDYSGKSVKKNISVSHSYKADSAATLTKNGAKKCSNCGQTQAIYYPKTIKLSNEIYTYNGKVKKPSVTVKDSKGNTIPSSAYKITYPSGMKNVGKYCVQVKFNGDYSGTKKLYYVINPASTSLSSVSASSKSFTVKWKKKTTQIKGYEIQYSTDSKFKKDCKIVNVSKNSTTSKKISGLKGNKKYYVRIRTYMKVGKTTYRSDWSKAKSVTTKK